MGKFIAGCILLFFMNYAYSQSLDTQSISSTGDTFKTSTLVLNWTIGEPISDTFYGVDKNTLTQGMHQTSFIINAIKDNLPNIEVKIFPNPTSQKINIEFEKDETFVNLQLHSKEGKLILEQKIQKNQDNISIDFSSYSEGFFILSLINTNNKIMSYKIIKQSR